MEERIASLLATTGPLTGAEIRDALGDASFVHWQASVRSPLLALRRVGRRYLRLDRKIEGYARLSPSILREFLTYTVVGPAGDETALDRRAAEIEGHIRAVSRAKLGLARELAAGIAARAPGDRTAAGQEPFCIVVAGDVVYDMAHDVPRAERSTGTIVQGSDLDLVILVDDGAPDELVARLDRLTYEKKVQYLVSPAFREEIDYVVKRLGRLREQAGRGDFKAMVACKIWDEATLLVGSEELFAAGRELLREAGVTDWLRGLEAAAIRSREEAERRLLAADEGALGAEEMLLFYTELESEEFE